MRRTAAVVLTVLGLLAVPAAASTTSGYQVRVRAKPTRVHAGATVLVRLIVYAVTPTGPVLTDARRLRLVAVSPVGARTPIGLRHVGRGTWTGAIRLRVAGRWLIRVSPWSASGAAPAVAVRVTAA